MHCAFKFPFTGRTTRSNFHLVYEAGLVVNKDFKLRQESEMVFIQTCYNIHY